MIFPLRFICLSVAKPILGNSFVSITWGLCNMCKPCILLTILEMSLKVFLFFSLKILNSVLDPFLMALQESVAGAPPADSSAYMVNCLHLLHSTLSLYNFTDDKVTWLKAQMDAKVEVLTNEQASFLVQRLGLGQIYMTLQQRTAAKGDPSSARNQIPLSQLPGMDTNSIQSFVVCTWYFW